MALFNLKPARDQIVEDTDEICDLDVVISRRASFTFQGKKHIILPITTEVLFQFWEETANLKKSEPKDPKEMNAAYLKIIRTVCDSISEKDVEKMTIVQKSIHLNHIAANKCHHYHCGDPSTQSQNYRFHPSLLLEDTDLRLQRHR